MKIQFVKCDHLCDIYTSMYVYTSITENVKEYWIAYSISRNTEQPGWQTIQLKK